MTCNVCYPLRALPFCVISGIKIMNTKKIKTNCFKLCLILLFFALHGNCAAGGWMFYKNTKPRDNSSGAFREELEYGV